MKSADNGGSERARGPLVLVVDDFDDGRRMYAACLRFAGYRTAEAASGAEALTVAAIKNPDLVLLDLAMPAMDGWETLSRMREDPRLQAIPVVLLTGHERWGDEDRARAVGSVGFLSKACMPEELIAVVRRALPGAPLAGPPSGRHRIRQ